MLGSMRTQHAQVHTRTHDTKRSMPLLTDTCPQVQLAWEAKQRMPAVDLACAPSQDTAWAASRLQALEASTAGTQQGAKDGEGGGVEADVGARLEGTGRGSSDVAPLTATQSVWMCVL
jgi:hypothetical protein